MVLPRQEPIRHDIVPRPQRSALALPPEADQTGPAHPGISHRDNVDLCWSFDPIAIKSMRSCDTCRRVNDLIGFGL